MAPKICIAVCGSSLYMAGIAASLEANPELDVVRVPANSPTLAEDLNRHGAALVAFDLGEISGDLALNLLQDLPQLLLIGVDPASDKLLVLSGRHEQPESAAGLVQAITASGAARSLDPISPVLTKEDTDEH